MLDHRLGDPRIHRIVAHLVADTVGAPAQCELGKVAGAQDDSAPVVRDAEQVIGAQPRLHVLEGHIVDVGALGVRVAHVCEELAGCGRDVDRLAGDAKGFTQGEGV